MNTIPVILSADDNYAPQMCTTMFSMLKNKHPNTTYDFYLLVPGQFRKRYRKKITKIADKYKCAVSFIDMKDMFADCKMYIAHITTPTYYRLLAADLLPQKYKKCIYLDVDICVLDDLSEMYDTDMTDNYIAGVPALTYYLNNENTVAQLGIPTAKHYINAGVLIMNLDLIRTDNLTEKFIALSKNNYDSQDQDVLNLACFGRIKILPLKYNFMTKYDFTKIENSAFYEVYGRENIENALTAPKIIHYADKTKPWFKKSSKYADIWWEYARRSPFALTFIYRYHKKHLFNK